MEDRAANIAGEDLTTPPRLPMAESRRAKRMRELRIRTLRHREPPGRAGEVHERMDKTDRESPHRRIREP